MPEIKSIVNRIKGRLDIAGENTTNLKTTVEILKHVQLILEFTAFLSEINFACL